MRWFRLHIRLGAHFALFALAVQFVLSFAHVHVSGFGSAIDGPKLAALFGAPTIGDITIAPRAPAKPHPTGLIGDTCAICALIQMLGSAPPAASPQLPSRLVVIAVVQFMHGGVALRATPHVLAQARAPPPA